MARTKPTFSTILSRSAIAIVLVLFAIAGVVAKNQMERNTSLQLQLRTASVTRAHLLRLQIDEETGIRGYAATGDAVLLQPYTSARADFDSSAQTLISTLGALNVDPSAARGEVAINQQWNAAIALPMIADRTRYNTLAVHLHGKALVDRFRKLDELLLTTLNGAAGDADVRATSNIETVLFSFLFAGVIVALGFAALAALLARTSSELEEQRRVADMLQNAFMRLDLPKLRRAELDAVYVPAEMEAKVGGDWYDAFELREGLILLSLGDVTGHGVEAAVIMSRVRQAILAVGAIERNPAALLTLVNEILLLQDSAMVTAVVAFVDLDKKTIDYSTAGHPPIILAHADGTTEKLPYWGPPLGAVDDVSYRSFSASAEPGSMLVLYTDGLLEQSKDIEIGEKRLVDAISVVQMDHAEHPAVALKNAVLANASPRDDVAILTMKFREEAYANKMVASR